MLLKSYVEICCDLCGSEERTPLFVKEGFVHVRCKNCGLVYVSPRLSDHLSGQVHAGTAEMGDDFLSKSQTKRLLDELKRLEQFRKLNRILEIGPGKGWFLEQANKLGWETWAVEVNSKALERLKAIGIHRIINDEESLNQILEESFDVVRIWDVLEHLESPKKTLAMSFNALRKAGIIKISTTNFRSLSRIVNGPNWVYLNGADHIVLFEPKTIDRMFREVGFSRIKVRTRSFNLRKKLYHPPEDLTKIPILIKPFRKLIDEAIQFTKYGHQLIVEAIKY